MSSAGLVRVDQPLLLITQTQRSGGTLLLRLLDGHPECHVFPFQMRGIDDAAKRMPTSADEAWAALYDPKLEVRHQAGFRQSKGEVLRDEETHEFELPPGLQRELYDPCVAALESPAPRDFFDCYFTSYFSAWLDYANPEPAGKRWLVGFEPGVSRSLRRRQAVHDLYPEGRVISILRDPWSWYASARRWEPEWADREVALNHWRRTTIGAMKWRNERKQARRDGGVRILPFEALLRDTEDTMRSVASWLGIEFRPELLQPTFNGRPIRANTSFSDIDTAVSARPLERAREELSDDDVDYIEQQWGALYASLAAKAAHDLRKMKADS